MHAYTDQSSGTDVRPLGNTELTMNCLRRELKTFYFRRAYKRDQAHSWRSGSARTPSFRIELNFRGTRRTGVAVCYSDLLDASWHGVYTFQPAIRPVVWTAGCTTGWVNYANEPNLAALERSSQDAYDVVRLIWRVWSKLKKNSYLFIYLFICYHRYRSIWSWGMTKITSITTLSWFVIYNYKYSKRYVQPVVQLQPVV